MAKTLPDPTGDVAERLALQYLARRDRSESQVAAYLARRGLPDARINRLLARWRANGYLDDERYALQWATDRLARRPRGRRRLEAELLAQGLDRAVVEQTLAGLYAERSERALAEALLAGKPREAEGAAALLRRSGFDEDVIEAILGSGFQADPDGEARSRLGPRAGRNARPSRKGGR